MLQRSQRTVPNQEVGRMKDRNDLFSIVLSYILSYSDRDIDMQEMSSLLNIPADQAKIFLDELVERGTLVYLGRAKYRYVAKPN